MTEAWQGVLGSLAIVPSIIFSVFTWFGGRDDPYFSIKARVWKRLIAPASFCVGVFILASLAGNLSLWILTAFPAFILSTHVGQGGNSLWSKLIARTMWSLSRTAASLTVAIPYEAWTLFTVQLGVGLLTALIIGVQNPVKAPQEEGLLNLCSVLFVPFMVL